jgi:hypothetical protein
MSGSSKGRKRGTRRSTAIGAVVVASSFFLAAPMARSDFLPAPDIYSAMQTDQTVEVVVRTFGPGLQSYWENDALSLLRHNCDGSEVIQDPKVFTDDDVAWTWDFCKYSAAVETDPWHCADFPDDCGDCDGDGIAECYGSCQNWFFLMIVDDCAPPGWNIYELLDYHGSWDESWEEDTDPGTWDATGIEVEDTGDSCLDHGGGCRVVGPGMLERPALFRILRSVVF